MRRILSIILVAIALLDAGEIGIAKSANGGARSLIGNTVHGFDVANGEEYWMYVRPDGTGSNAFPNGDVSSFTWSLNGENFCTTSSDGTECSTFAIKGNSGIETSTAGHGVGASGRIQIIRGDPRGL